MYDALIHAYQMLNVWNWSDSISARDYDVHTWRIAVEFRSFKVLLGFDDYVEIQVEISAYVSLRL